ncbi:hypothetical protein [Microvirga makkahensis]|uniref:Uncharacterized protein n=1 Tax=Microvirga makkahensis TaxID=1128670 RepID=A0A7X3SPQ7_9HYPH|nr:hypothetical protein [Microvirga makkahensis]MXQ12468.1 hypothetical protein [Microvirga makkahensis]
MKRFDHCFRASVVAARKAGDEVKITGAEYEAANAAGSMEIINGESAEQGETAAEAGGTAPKGKAGDRSRA